MTDKRIFVLAGTYQQFIDYCRQRGLAVGRDARYIGRPEQLLGLRGVVVAKYGTWWENPAAEMLVERWTLNEYREATES